MNKLSHDERCKVLHMLCEGSSIRAITRIHRVGKNTVARLLCDAGKACMAHHDEHVRNVKSKRIQCDEIWSFCYAKQRNVEKAKAAPEGAGDVWTWTAIDADSKLILSFLVADRGRDAAMTFMHDLRMRVKGSPQITTDQWKSYIPAVEEAFGRYVDFAQLVKIFRSTPGGPGRYSPGECVGAKIEVWQGNPDERHISTSFVERQNLTMRMHMRRFTRLTNAFSKKIENHAYAVALHMTYYNFVKTHSKLRMPPAMEAGISERPWEIDDIVALVEAAEIAEGSKPRGPYKKR